VNNLAPEVISGMDAPAIAARAAVLQQEVERLHALPEWRPGEAAAFDRINDELTLLEERRATLRADLIRRAAGQNETGDGAATAEARRTTTRPAPMITTPFLGGDLRADALRTIDAAHRSRRIPDHAAEKASALVETGSLMERSIAARWATTTGADAYRTAFAKLVGDPTRGHLLWTPEEADAYRAVEQFRSEVRGMSLTDSAGGYMVPFTLDPAIILTNAGSTSPIRRIARVVQTVTDTWNGVSSAGVTAEWLAEGAEASDAAPTLAQPTVAVQKGAAFVPFSIEYGMDAERPMEELTRLLVDAADRLMDTAYWSGQSGSGQPIGIETALNGGASEVAPTTAEVFAIADIYKTANALPARWHANAQWAAQLSTINAIRQFATSSNYHAFLTDLGGGNPAQMLGRPLHEWSAMDPYSAVDAAATAVHHLLLFGDFQQFVIADRIGTTIEVVPHLFNTANNRPDGRRGLWMFFRTGSDVVVDDAFRLLTVTTAA
jgi:HK97 family phage major capsid protein